MVPSTASAPPVRPAAATISRAAHPALPWRSEVTKTQATPVGQAGSSVAGTKDQSSRSPHESDGRRTKWQPVRSQDEAQDRRGPTWGDPLKAPGPEGTTRESTPKHA